MLNYLWSWKPVVRRTIVYAGEPAGLRHLESAGFKASPFRERSCRAQVLVAGPGAGKELARGKEAIARWLKAGGNLLAIGLDEEDANAFCPFGTEWNGEISLRISSPLIAARRFGVGPADVHNRDPRDISLVRSVTTVIGDGVLARTAELNVVFCQLVPWQFHETGKMNIRARFAASRSWCRGCWQIWMLRQGLRSCNECIRRLRAGLKNAGSRAFISTSRKRWTTRTGSFGGEQRRPAAVTARTLGGTRRGECSANDRRQREARPSPISRAPLEPRAGATCRDRRVNT